MALSDKDFHQFIWRDDPKPKLKDYRMTDVTFGVSASLFIANMCVKQNAIDFKSQFPNAPKEVQKLFYVNDYLRGADSAEQAIGLPSKLFSTLQVELQ